MDTGGLHRRRGATRPWWALSAHVLVLALALFIVAPAADVGDDLAFHAPRQYGLTEMVALDTAAPEDTANSGFACHLHCGCHQMASPEVMADITPLPELAALTYPRVTEVPASVAPDRLARPPRA